MSVFHVEITDHRGHFGATARTEQITIGGLLQTVAERIGSHVSTATEENPEPLILNGEQVGRFWFGPKSHSLPSIHATAGRESAGRGRSRDPEGRPTMPPAR